MSTCFLNTFRIDDSTTSLASLFQCLTTLSVEKIFPNIQSKPPLMQLKTIASRPIASYLGKRPTPPYICRCWQTVSSVMKEGWWMGHSMGQGLMRSCWIWPRAVCLHIQFALVPPVSRIFGPVLHLCLACPSDCFTNDHFWLGSDDWSLMCWKMCVTFTALETLP